MPVVRSGDADIAYTVQGSGDPLLMIMGFAADARMWMLQLPTFEQRYSCITFDNRGAGSSTLPGPCTMEDMAADAIAVLDDLGIERARVLGISMGGAIAQHLALKTPERVRSLVLASTWSRRNAYTQRVARLGRQILEQLGHEALVQAFMLWLFTPKFMINNAEFAHAIEQMMLDFVAPNETFLLQLQALLEHDVHDRLGQVRIPTRVMVGRRDILVPPELSYAISEAIPDADLIVLESGHAYNVEEMDAFNNSVMEFFARY